MWLIVAGGYYEDYPNHLATTQRLDMTANTWEDLGDMKQKRQGHTMINSQRGIMVLGGYGGYGSSRYSRLKSVELLVGKKWEKIEPSLVTPRDFFGGAVQVKASLFDCQVSLNEIKKPGM